MAENNAQLSQISFQL